MGKSQQVVISWCGPGKVPEEHLLAQEGVDSLICCPEDEDTIVITLPSSGWMKLFILNIRPKLVYDMYSVCGELNY